MPALDYVESSTGFQRNPRLDAGRSELEFADIDNDGNIDILSVGDHGSPYINTQEHGVMVWFGDGRGNWSVCQFGEFGYGGIAVGDVNNDGFWDVGYGIHHDYSGTDLGDQLIEVALGDGTGRDWVPWDDSLAGEGQDWGMHATDFGDFDNDGLLDVGSISFGADDGLHAYKNLGNGAWRRTFGFLGGNSAMEFYFRDVNRDGNLDIIAAHGTGSIWFGDGAGGFNPANDGLPFSSYGLRGLSPGDVDNDGGADVAFANADGGVEVWAWADDQLRWVDFSGNLPSVDSFQATQLCDMDADGFVDLLAFGRGKTKVWLGDGMGNWTEAAGFNTRGAGTYAALRSGADLDHNGRPDIAYWAREGNWLGDTNIAHVFLESSPVESLGAFLVSPRGGEVLPEGAVRFVDWWSAAPEPESTLVRLELSISGPGGPWLPVAQGLSNSGRFQWFVPAGSASPDCYLRCTVTEPGREVSAMNPRPFTIAGKVGADEQRPVRAPAASPLRLRTSLVGERAELFLDGVRPCVARFLLADCCGRIVRTWEVPLTGGTTKEVISLELSGLPSGVYSVRVLQAGQVAGGRLVRCR